MRYEAAGMPQITSSMLSEIDALACKKAALNNVRGYRAGSITDS